MNAGRWESPTQIGNPTLKTPCDSNTIGDDLLVGDNAHISFSVFGLLFSAEWLMIALGFPRLRMWGVKGPAVVTTDAYRL